MRSAEYLMNLIYIIFDILSSKILSLLIIFTNLLTGLKINRYKGVRYLDGC